MAPNGETFNYLYVIADRHMYANLKRTKRNKYFCNSNFRCLNVKQFSMQYNLQIFIKGHKTK